MSDTRPIVDIHAFWQKMKQDAEALLAAEPFLQEFVQSRITDCATMEQGLAVVLAEELAQKEANTEKMRVLFYALLSSNPDIVQKGMHDLMAVQMRDPAAKNVLTPFLFFKGFHAIQTHRIAHELWERGQRATALFLQNRSSLVYGVDIHPAAQMGCGIMVDHATSLVIGETAVVEDDVSILHEVTLGGTGKEQGDRHPKIRKGVMIGAGAKILGNIEIGTGACIAAGSVVLTPVPPHVTVAGVPAKIVGTPKCEAPAFEMTQELPQE